MKSSWIFVALLASTVSGHIQMSEPLPIRSPLDPNNGPETKDYSYTSPLSPDGEDFPCKGYANDPAKPVAEYVAGQQYTMKTAGSAVHGGGSCQLSLSYDKQRFTVIKSIEGGCPLAGSYTFTIPPDAPSGQALFAWTWFNKIGNREMYMNCAWVTIKGGSQKRSHPRHIIRRQDSFSSRPPIFIANVNGPGGCTTIAGQEVKFPLPGPDVEGSVSGKGYECKGSADFLGDGGPVFATNSSSGGGSGTTSFVPDNFSSNESNDAPSSSSSSASTTTTSSSSSSSSSLATPDSSSTASSSSSASSAPFFTPFSSTTQQAGPSAGSSSFAAAPSNTPPASQGSGESCSEEGAIVCGSDGQTFSICVHGSLTFMGQVAAGTACRDGKIDYAGAAQ
ncbi:hypothetical protein VTN49DRAFT_8128 [Thermomyces lanuginosus]|uniref:uncharacterized protein n=1 Tax=Thermomyces lanuginosus TaxID=5541 RepID=UPI0037421094